MKTKMIGVPTAMLPPADRPNWRTSYVLKNGEFDPETRTWKDKLVNPGHISFKERYPGEEIEKVTRSRPPLGEAGVVELVSLKGANEAERLEAQLFYFPDWMDIQKGKTKLLNTISAIERHIRTRLAECATLEDSPAGLQRFVEAIAAGAELSATTNETIPCKKCGGLGFTREV